jgi:copper transport protein
MPQVATTAWRNILEGIRAERSHALPGALRPLARHSCKGWRRRAARTAVKEATIRHRHPARRGRLAAMLVVALAAVAWSAPSANAHSVLIATEPKTDQVVQQEPQQVLLRFNETVDTSLGDALRVFDGQGNQVSEGEVMRPSGPEVAIGLADDLAPGTYTVAWRVISADSDPISGAFVFHVGQRGVAATGISVESLTGTPASVDAAFAITRFLDFGLLLLCLGGTVIVALALPSASWPVKRTLFGVLAVGAAALVVAALLNVVFQGAAAAGVGLSEAFSWDRFTTVLETRYGEMMLLQAALGATLALTAVALRNSESRAQTGLLALALALGLGMSITPSLSGHASSEGGIAIVSDWAHVVSAAIWTGGLGFLVLALLRSGSDRWPLATRAVPRFSNLAVGSVIVLLIAGIINGYLQVRTWSNLWETTYGLLLLAKVALVIPLLALGAYNNRYAVPRLRAGIASVLERRRFLRAAGTELAVMVSIVAVTAVLVNAEPAHTESEAMEHTEGSAMTDAEHHGPFEGTVALEGTDVMVTVDPAMPGDNTITLMFMPVPENLTEVGVSASVPSQNIGPLDFVAKPDPTAQGTYVVENASLALAGTWDLRIEALIGEFDLLTETIAVPIGGA